MDQENEAAVEPSEQDAPAEETQEAQPVSGFGRLVSPSNDDAIAAQAEARRLRALQGVGQ